MANTKKGLFVLISSLSLGFMTIIACNQSNAKAPSEVNPRGQILAMSCTTCHGPDGKSAGMMPKLNGKTAEYIESQLKRFKAGEGKPTVMDRIAKGYTDDELKLIAEFFGNLKK
ncbi:MAG: c-type cytochrome [Chlorobiales bacterium]|nr:c-type cytochrome [Chlorobiales bacterium]